MKIYFVGSFLNLFLPASSGDLAKAYFGYRLMGVKERMVAASLLDKVLGISSITFLGFPAAYFLDSKKYMLVSLLPLLLIVSLIFFSKTQKSFLVGLGFIEKFRKHFDFQLLLTQLKIANVKILWAIMWSLLGWIATYWILALCFRAVGINVSIAYVFMIAPVITLIRLFPFSFNGIGTDEAALLFFFSCYGNIENIVMAGILFRIMIMFVPAIIGLLCVWCMGLGEKTS